ncbi:MAG: radical SAM family heme chaperone HemW [Cyanobacteria bacterium P01_A01_bin.83]
MTKNISLINSQLNSLDISSLATPTAAYIHIPFCRRRCYYCDFPISVVGDKGKSTSTMVQDYLNAVINEIQLTAPSSTPLKTIFFGGGTPSLLSAPQLEQIVKAIALKLGIASDAEISIEIDPGTFDRQKLRGYLDLGVNRFSLGVQTFDEELLKVCGRSHTLEDVMQSVEIIKQLNINNFSLDLISGLPHQTLDHCQSSLTQAIAIAPQHLSCYDLVLEPVTAFGKQYQPGKTPLPNDDTAAEMYRLTQHMLTGAGYEHYEISNYAQPGYQCRHNQVYWKNQSYFAFGMGAASYVDGQRFSRPRTRREYYAWLQAGAIINAPVISATDYLLETLMLGLRLAAGINLEQFLPANLKQIWSCLQPYYDQGWVEIIDVDGKKINLTNFDLTKDLIATSKLRLSDPEGFLFSNTILAALFEQLE